MEKCNEQYNYRTTNKLNWLRQALKAVSENNTLHEKRIALKRQENVELKREIQRLRTELLKKEAVDMTKDAAVEVSSQPLMVSSWPTSSLGFLSWHSHIEKRKDCGDEVDHDVISKFYVAAWLNEDGQKSPRSYFEGFF